MRVSVDLARCQSYGQCLFAAPDLFRLPHTEVLEYESAPDDDRGPELARARAACPVQAIELGPPAPQRAGGGPGDA